MLSGGMFCSIFDKFFFAILRIFIISALILLFVFLFLSYMFFSFRLWFSVVYAFTFFQPSRLSLLCCFYFCFCFFVSLLFKLLLFPLFVSFTLGVPFCLSSFCHCFCVSSFSSFFFLSSTALDTLSKFSSIPSINNR
jgi:hypothetical protein